MAKRTYAIENLPIDDVETFQQYGYSATSVGPHSTKKVIIRCAVCKEAAPRQRRQVKADSKCRHHSSTDPALLRVKKDRIEERFGPAGLKGIPRKAEHVDPNRKVLMICTACGKEVLRHHKTAQRKNWRCATCAGRGAFSQRNYPIGGLPIDVEATIREFGYRPEWLKPTSNRAIIIICTVCSKREARARGFVTPDVKCLHHRFSDPAMVEKKRVTLIKNHGENAQAVIAGRRQATIRERYDETPFVWTKKPESGAEREIKALIEGVFGKGSVTKKILECGLHIDLYLATKKVGIEYHGLYYHHELSPQPRGPDYHARKLREARREGIRLIQVFEDEWVKRRGVVEDVVFSILGKPGRKIPARKCKVREISLEDARSFMKDHHLQGASKRALFASGIFLGEELLGTATLAHHHRQIKGALVFDRLCFGRGVQVVGGAGRLLSILTHEARRRSIRRIITWSDNRWSDGTVYVRTGFTKEAELKPDYQYVNVKNPKERLSKQSQKKSVTKCPPGKTEHQWALERGLARIWDAGKVRWTKQL